MPQPVPFQLDSSTFAHRLFAAVAAFGVAFAAWTVDAAAEEPRRPVNTLCPVMTQEEVKPEFIAVFEGRVIGFCCEKCLAKFEANPGRYAGRLGELEQKSPPVSSDHSHSEETANQADSREEGAHGDHAHVDDAAQDIDQESAHEHDHDEDEHSDGHDHEHGHAQGKGLITKMIGWFGKFHPPMVNFPIAMILGTALAEILLLTTKRSFFVNAGRFCLWVGCVGAVVGAVLGWFFGGFHLLDESWILTTHRWLGTTTAVWSVLLLVVGERTYRRGAGTRSFYRAMLFVGAATVLVTGFFGGALIYGMNHYSWSG